VGRRVWRGICKVGCGCAELVEACDRVTMMQVMGQALLFVSVLENCLGINSSFFWSKVVHKIVMLQEVLLLGREGEKF